MVKPIAPITAPEVLPTVPRLVANNNAQRPRLGTMGRKKRG
jgi:hypothetical protein